MNDVGWSTGDDRVVLILAGSRVTLSATLLQTDHFFQTEVPAAWTLAEIAANSAEVPDLRCRYRVRSFREPWETLTHASVLFEFRQRDEGADREPSRRERDAVQAADVF